MLSDVPQIVVRNQSKLNPQQAWIGAWALGYQIRWQMGPIWKMDATVTFLPSGVAVPSGAWIIDLLNLSDQENALGYHDEDGNENPYGRIFVATAEADGIPWTEVLSHEGIELLANPHVNATVFDPISGRLYPRELGDPAQGDPYDLAAPYNRPPIGVTMSDWVLPSWFDVNTPSHQPTSYRGACEGPFGLGKGGYVSFTKTLPPSWEQQLGAKADLNLISHTDRINRA